MLDSEQDVFNQDYPAEGSDEEYTLEEIAKELDYDLPIPAEWFPPQVPNIDGDANNADWLKKP